MNANEHNNQIYWFKNETKLILVLSQMDWDMASLQFSIIEVSQKNKLAM